MSLDLCATHWIIVLPVSPNHERIFFWSNTSIIEKWHDNCTNIPQNSLKKTQVSFIIYHFELLNYQNKQEQNSRIFSEIRRYLVLIFVAFIASNATFHPLPGFGGWNGAWAAWGKPPVDPEELPKASNWAKSASALELCGAGGGWGWDRQMSKEKWEETRNEWMQTWETIVMNK